MKNGANNKMTHRMITAPVIIPDKKDCDHARGEPPLTQDQIINLKNTFDKDYGFIDYDHYLTDPTSPWYLKLVGTPVKSWISTKSTKYTNVLGITETIPKGTWWLTSKVTDPVMIKQIDEGLITAYSITVGNKAFCDNFKREVLTANKHDNEDYSFTVDTTGLVATKNKTLIKDIVDPVGLSVSLTGMPCVGSATFSKKCLEESQSIIAEKTNGGQNMSEETKFSISELLGLQKLFATKSDENAETKEETAPEKEPEQEPKDDEFVTREEFTEAIDETNKKVDEIGAKVDKILEKLEPKEKPEEEEEEGEEEAPKKPAKEEDEKKTAQKNNPSQSSQLDNTDDGNNQNTAQKNNSSDKAKLMHALHRKGNGEYKFPRIH